MTFFALESRGNTDGSGGDPTIKRSAQVYRFLLAREVIMKALIFSTHYSLHSADITCAYAQESNIQLNHAAMESGLFKILEVGAFAIQTA